MQWQLIKLLTANFLDFHSFDLILVRFPFRSFELISQGKIP